MPAYKHLFFDLDHTLWDFERNSNETLADLYDHFGLENYCISGKTVLQQTFGRVNAHLWHLHDTNRITKPELRHRRFREVMSALGCDDHPHCDEYSEWYLAHCSYKPHLLPGTKELLDYLAPRYDMHILTNGFDEVQAIKMSSSGITDYFREVITVSRAGAQKPEEKMFRFALELTGAAVAESLMIGDNPETDIAGALSIGMDAVYFRPEQSHYPAYDRATYQISELKELHNLL